MTEALLALFLGLSALVLLIYFLNPRFRADVDADTARRRRRKRRLTPDPVADAEIWQDPPTNSAAFDRWFDTHGTSEDPRIDRRTGD